MKRLSATIAVLDYTERIKPFLIKILPISFLRSVKRSLVKSSLSKLESEPAFIPFSSTSHPDGINLIGYIRGEIGLGESCRLVAGSLDEAALDFTICNYEQISSMRHGDTTWDQKITDTTPYNINLIHIQPYELPFAFMRIGRKAWDRRYNIAFWLWELEKFPQQWENALKLVDEVWTPSEFASRSIRLVTDKPVHTIPYGISIPDAQGAGRRQFSLPNGKFLFLCMYDCNSYFERKNPMAAISAYKTAFTPEEQGAGIVIKLNNPKKMDMQIIREELSGYSNVFFIEEVLEKKQVNELISCVDAYVSLHRSEGFGLIPAEAMMLGTPVIATNWSANTEFMNNETACMVGYSFITIEKDHGPYEAGNRWADPDINQAAEYMRKLYEDTVFHRQIADSAKAHINEMLAPARAAALIRERIAEIYSTSN